MTLKCIQVSKDEHQFLLSSKLTGEKTSYLIPRIGCHREVFLQCCFFHSRANSFRSRQIILEMLETFKAAVKRKNLPKFKALISRFFQLEEFLNNFKLK